MKGQILTRSGFYQCGDDGHLHFIPDARVEPHVCISRRVTDFPHGHAPAGAQILTCDACGVAVASDGRFRDKPRLCFQCAGIAPLPIEAES